MTGRTAHKARNCGQIWFICWEPGDRFWWGSSPARRVLISETSHLKNVKRTVIYFMIPSIPHLLWDELLLRLWTFLFFILRLDQIQFSCLFVEVFRTLPMDYAAFSNALIWRDVVKLAKPLRRALSNSTSWVYKALKCSCHTANGFYTAVPVCT